MESQVEKRNSSNNSKDEIAPPSALTYLDPLYWNERFAKEQHYEWFKDYSHFRHLILEHIQPHSSVLELGCGNSQLSDEMHKDGIKDITCTDLSPVAVHNLQTRVSDKGFTEIKAMVADMLDLPFSDETFDVVIEKGTMDVLFVDSGDPWNPQAETVKKVMAMLQGVHRVLKPDGIFISISFGQPHFRRPIFEAREFTWSMKWDTFGDGFHYFFYTLKKCLLKATNGFSAENMLGSGGFGVVYKGSLGQDNTLIAIKIFKLENRGASQSFMAECGVLRNIRHRNLIKVITACSSVDYQGRDFKALVYEYMVNGSLDDWLHPKAIKGHDGTNNPTKIRFQPKT
ncbi:uncharacterized protein LOC141657539 isoform X1 [Silene latifolia]|uniref:uncharacterized protein LOC141657539 isoform X1 n=1 Tax=Silene latifolia TaxID=37657 RepID=UPI003D784648